MHFYRKAMIYLVVLHIFALWAGAAPPLRPGQPIRQSVRPQMTVPGEHLHGAVAGNSFDFHDIQVRVLEQAGDGFMAQVVKG